METAGVVGFGIATRVIDNRISLTRGAHGGGRCDNDNAAA